MDTSVAIQLIILLILLILSGFFSSAETALTTVNRMRIRGLADEGSKRAKTVMRITDDTSKMLSAILIGNNIVNVSASSLALLPPWLTILAGLWWQWQVQFCLY